ncbi:ribonuclease H-like domain-containing protein [Epithele typhae]|uniref:ribonuclease H-like domain-containing protein n=1 Tax=Epithele typhae TaxID=378194 RepID=UPI002007DC5B|nr:ribonuclease H-like domain-containing protein [Epithele typhae]KAH9936731.1 ribonuclease H-like domain-containing protein [Epithele typhae]
MDACRTDNVYASQIIQQIGVENFSSIVSDDTGNTRKTRGTVTKRHEWMLNFADTCHRLHNTAQDIGKLSAFKKTIATCKRVVKYFAKSTIAKTALKRAMLRKNIKRGLVGFSKTRFAGVVHSAESVRRCLPALHEIVEKEASMVDIPVHLSMLLSILGPIAKAIECLESAHSTLADVFMFWLAVMASYDTFLADTSRSADLSDETKDEIRRILNYRWKQMIEPPLNTSKGDHTQGTSVYVAAFVLHPGDFISPTTDCPVHAHTDQEYRSSGILKPTVVIRQVHPL